MATSSVVNPSFFAWNKVQVRYCDGFSFTGGQFTLSNHTLLTYVEFNQFENQKKGHIWLKSKLYFLTMTFDDGIALSI